MKIEDFEFHVDLGPTSSDLIYLGFSRMVHLHELLRQHITMGIRRYTSLQVLTRTGLLYTLDDAAVSKALKVPDAGSVQPRPSLGVSDLRAEGRIAQCSQNPASSSCGFRGKTVLYLRNQVITLVIVTDHWMRQL